VNRKVRIRDDGGRQSLELDAEMLSVRTSSGDQGRVQHARGPSRGEDGQFAMASLSQPKARPMLFELSCRYTRRVLARLGGLRTEDVISKCRHNEIVHVSGAAINANARATTPGLAIAWAKPQASRHRIPWHP